MYELKKKSKETKLRYNNNQQPNLLMLDLASNVNLYKTVQSLLKQNTIVAVWISNHDLKLLPDLFALGIHGYFHKDMKPSELLYAVKSILKGKCYIHPQFIPILLKEHKYTDVRPKGFLTKREWDVLELIVKGYSNNAIATQLNIATKTAKSHILSLFRKLKVDNRTNAAVTAIKNNWFAV